MKKNYRKYKGFTLIELLVVIAIITLLSAVVLNSVAASRMKAADVKVAEDLRQVKIAAELYYLDNKTYPPTASITNEPKTAHADIQNNMWAKKLSFFVKVAEAQSSAIHNTPLCANFDRMASGLVAGKYLAQIPRHPYDNDAKGVCYKAMKTDKTFVSYGALTQLVSVTKLNESGKMNKRAGFIAGDTSLSSLGEINGIYNDPSLINEAPYPIDANYGTGYDDGTGNFDSIDAVEGITNGASSAGISDSISNFITSLVGPPVGPSPQQPVRLPPAMCLFPWKVDPNNNQTCILMSEADCSAQDLIDGNNHRFYYNNNNDELHMCKDCGSGNTYNTETSSCVPR